jgi:hypothetical protein
LQFVGELCRSSGGADGSERLAAGERLSVRRFLARLAERRRWCDLYFADTSNSDGVVDVIGLQAAVDALVAVT